MKSALSLLSILLLATLTIGLLNIALSSSAGQQSRSHSSEAGQQAHSYSHKPATSILAVKSLYPLHGTVSKDGIKDDFARLNRRNKYAGSITRDAIHKAVVQTKRQRPSQDIVVMGVASWN